MSFRCPDQYRVASPYGLGDEQNGWFVLSLLITPLIAGLLVLVLPSKATDPDAPTPETHVKCPDCRELVLKEARVCKHCRCKLVPQA